MSNRDSITYVKLSRITKKHLHWIGLSEAARDVLSTLLAEHYWTGDSLSSDDLVDLTGYSRGSISVALSQLRSLGFIESQIETSYQKRGRKPTFYTIAEGFSGIASFGVRRLSLELEGILREVEAMRLSMDGVSKKEKGSLKVIEDEVSRNLEQLTIFIREMRSAQMSKK